jgi:hypothetical protein
MTASTPTRPIAVLYEYCEQVYKMMLEQATPTNRGGDAMMLWEGFLTTLIVKDLKFSTPYYSYIRGGLVRMGCIRQIRRGGAATPSLWEIITEPTEEAFREASEPAVSKAKKESSTDQRIRDLAQRMDDMQEVIDLLVELNNNGAEGAA